MFGYYFPMKSVIEPWGVYIPFIYGAIAYWALGALQIVIGGNLHPLFMMSGAYLFYVGMMFRLFAPARKYIVGHLVTLVLLLSLTPVLIGAGMGVAFMIMMWAIGDVMNYGSKFPINYLVLVSSLAGTVSWYVFSFFHDFYVLEVPLLLYVLGVNVGIFSATLGARPLLGKKQIPLLLTILASYFFPSLINLITVVYPFLLIRGRTFRVGINLTTLSALLNVGAIVFSGIFGLFEGGLYPLHSFTVGIMTVLLMSCSTYSLARYNYGWEWLIPLLLVVDLITFTGIPWVLALLLYLYLVRNALGLYSLKNGISSRFISQEGSSKHQRQQGMK
ncbi:hypothetical protein L3N51_00423 [Metallosphaera sp. J1]|nr:hypothetical protein [Metallosphaera javensis (ex Hofmann et al. 2022)]